MTNSDGKGQPTPGVGVQSLLLRAIGSPSFLEQLLKTRSAAADAVGIVLTPAERAVVDAAPAEQLRSMVEQLRTRASCAPVTEQMLVCTGIRPDMPSVPPGIGADRPSPIPRGHSSVVPAAAAVGLVLVGGGVAIATCCTLGHRPDGVEVSDAGERDSGRDGGITSREPGDAASH